jgi:hypothetical protein
MLRAAVARDPPGQLAPHGVPIQLRWEATNEGTVHGAIATGERAARQAIKAQNRVD